MKKIFIAGQMRSGTTLLTNVLSIHQEMAILPDFLHIERLRKYASVKNISKQLTVEQKYLLLAKFFSANDGLQALEEAYNYNFNISVSANEFNTIVDFYNLILEKISEKTQKQIVGHKTTDAEKILSPMLKKIDNLKVIFIYRDPRDVLLSYINRGLSGITKQNVVERWKEGYIKLSKLRKLYEGKKIMIIRFDDFIINNINHLKQISKYIGITDFPDKIENINHFGGNFKDNSSFSDIDKLFDKKAINRWQKSKQKKKLNFIVNKIIDKQLLEDAGFIYVKDDFCFTMLFETKTFIQNAFLRIKKILKCILKK